MMEETIQDMDKEIELNTEKIVLPADKIKNSDEETIKRMEKVSLTKILGETDKLTERLDKTIEKRQGISY